MRFFFRWKHLEYILQRGGDSFNLFNLTGQRATCILNWIEIARLMELLSSQHIMWMSRGTQPMCTKVVSILFMVVFTYAPNLPHHLSLLPPLKTYTFKILLLDLKWNPIEQQLFLFLPTDLMCWMHYVRAAPNKRLKLVRLWRLIEGFCLVNHYYNDNRFSSVYSNLPFSLFQVLWF